MEGWDAVGQRLFSYPQGITNSTMDGTAQTFYMVRLSALHVEACFTALKLLFLSLLLLELPSNA